MKVVYAFHSRDAQYAGFYEFHFNALWYTV
jgi:hypothetical protein